MRKKNNKKNKLLLAEGKFVPEIHLRQPGFTYSASGLVNKKRIQKFEEAGAYQNKLDKACVHKDLTYGDFEDLLKRTASNKVLRDKAFNITKNAKYDGYQRGFASMVYAFLIKALLHVQINLLLILLVVLLKIEFSQANN